MRNKVVALGALLIACVLGTATAAQAQEPTTTTTAPTTTTSAPGQPSPTGEAVRGLLFYEDGDGERQLVEGVEVAIEDAAGAEIGTGTTDVDGVFEVLLPGPGSYTATIDIDTLPEDITLRDEDRATLTFDMSVGRTRNLLYPLQSGEGGGSGGDSLFDRGARLFVEGIRFGLVIAMCAIGLSLIFGTTGLTNFSHGEMVTFGAIVAWVFNVTYGWPFIAAAIVAVLVSIGMGFSIDRLFWRPLRNRGTGPHRHAGHQHRPRAAGAVHLPVPVRRVQRGLPPVHAPGRDRVRARARRAPRPHRHGPVDPRARGRGHVPAAHPHGQGHAGGGRQQGPGRVVGHRRRPGHRLRVGRRRRPGRHSAASSRACPSR